MTRLDLATVDRGRQFAALPQTTGPMTLRGHIARLPEVTMGPFVYSVIVGGTRWLATRILRRRGSTYEHRRSSADIR